MGRHLRACLAMFLVMMILCPAALADFDAKTCSTAKIYAGADTSSQKLALLDRGIRLQVTEITGQWARISYQGRSGYCALMSLTSLERVRVYVQKDTSLYASASTSNRICSVPKGASVLGGGVRRFLLIQNPSNGYYGYVKSDCVGKRAPATSSGQTPSSGAAFIKSKVVKINWNNGGDSVLKKGEYAYMYDIVSGITIRIKRMGGSAHMDVEPATAEDTAKLLKIYGGTFSWDSKAVILIAGNTYVAAAINGAPHGEQTIYDNNYDGQFCLHLTGSQTHGSSSVNDAHQANIERAYLWAHS